MVNLENAKRDNLPTPKNLNAQVMQYSKNKVLFEKAEETTSKGNNKYVLFYVRDEQNIWKFPSFVCDYSAITTELGTETDTWLGLPMFMEIKDRNIYLTPYTLNR